MSYLWSLISKSPFLGLIRGAHELWISLNEMFLNIETKPSAHGPGARQGLPDFRGIHTDRAQYDDNTHYEPADYHQVRRMIRVLDPGVEDVLYDIGCGKGRVLCVAARRRLKRVVGIDLFEELCEIARNNAKHLRGKKTPIDVICEDATKVDYSDGTIFTMYNPFGESTMRNVMQAIHESIRKNPRSIRIGYYNPVHEGVLEEALWLEPYTAGFETVGGTRVKFWQSKPDVGRSSERPFK